MIDRTFNYRSTLQDLKEYLETLSETQLNTLFTIGLTEYDIDAVLSASGVTLEPSNGIDLAEAVSEDYDAYLKATGLLVTIFRGNGYPACQRLIDDVIEEITREMTAIQKAAWLVKLQSDLKAQE